MDQLLWDGGRTLMSRKLERLELGFSHSQLERMASDAAESALGMYRNVILSRAVLKIREAALESLSEQRRILKEETELGLALAADLAEADLALADTKIEIQSLYADLEELEHQFADVLGLAKLPPLEEKVDIGRGAFPPRPEAARSLAQERNPELAEARLSIVRKQDELKLASRSWIPSLRLVGGFALTGPDYPLNRCNWTLGISIEFSDPWFQNSFGFQAGWEPPYDRTAQLQNTFSPLPDPAAGLDRHQAKLALGLEREKYSRSFERVGRTAVLAVEKYAIADRKRSLAVEALALAGERCRLEEFRLSLGQITRIELMEELVEYSKKEIAAAEAAAALLEAERELERLLDLKPGELADFTAGNKTYRGES
jgi:outer membrane protein TolC